VDSEALDKLAIIAGLIRHVGEPDVIFNERLRKLIFNVSYKGDMTKIHTFAWVQKNIQPVLNELGGEIFGGFVRDYAIGTMFNDVDINYPHKYSEENLNNFVNCLHKNISKQIDVLRHAGSPFNEMIDNKYIIKIINTKDFKVGNYYTIINGNDSDFFGPTTVFKDAADIKEIKRSKISITNIVTLEVLKIDLVWDHQADETLDVDIHALYLDSSWNICVYPQPKYRNALENAKSKQFIALDAAPWRIEKLLDKGYTEFKEGMLGGVYENLTHPKRLE